MGSHGLPWQSAKKDRTHKGNVRFVVLLNNLHKCGGRSLQGFADCQRPMESGCIRFSGVSSELLLAGVLYESLFFNFQ